MNSDCPTTNSVKRLAGGALIAVFFAVCSSVQAAECVLTCPQPSPRNNDSGQCGASVSYDQPTISGNCTGLTVKCAPAPGFFPIGTTTVTCVATDAANATVTSCSFGVVVTPTESPQISYPAGITKCTDQGKTTAIVNFSVEAHDVCGALDVSCNPKSGTEFPIGTTSVHCSGQRGSSDSVSASFDVKVNDCSGPQITCPANITQCVAAGKCVANVAFDVTASPGATVVCTPKSGSEFPKGPTPVSCTATDAAGKTSNCGFSVIVTDCEAPKIVCPANITQCKDAGKNTAVVNYQVQTTDNCGNPTVVCNPLSGSTFVMGPTTVSCTTTDGAGATANCSFLVTVNDCSAPQIQCPADITKCVDAGKCSAVVTFDVTASGSATVVCTPKSGSEFQKGTTAVACTASIATGVTANCGFNVIVNDCEAPKITCPADMTKCLSAGQTTVAVSYSVTATDNCGTAPVVCTPASGSAFQKGTATVLCIATDPAGKSASCSFAVTVNDCTAPQIQCPANITKCTDAGKCLAVVTFDVTASGSATVVCTPKSGSEFQKGTTTVACTASNAAGATANCGFNVTVNDCEAPKMTCPADMTKCLSAGQTTVAVSYSVTATDNCGAAPVVCTPASGSAFQKGTTTVLCIATDPAGKSASCSFAVMVNDCEVPQIQCPANITKCTDAGKCSAVVTFDVSATGSATVVCTPKSGSEFQKGTTAVACTTSNAAGATANCGFNVTVNDCEGPKITCPGNLTKCYDAGKQSAVVTYAVTGSDSCGAAPVVCTPASGSVFQKGTTTVSCTATDAVGKTANCSFAVAVIDCAAPSVICPGNITQCTDPGQCSAVVNYKINDNGFPSVVCDPKAGSEFSKGVTTVTCKATDASGNSTVCGFTVTVNPCGAPKISSITASPDVIWPPNHKMVPVTLDVITDNCGAADCKIVSVTSSEAGVTHGKGNKGADQWTITGDLSLQLQADRAGNGSGRLYTVTVMCTDAAGAKTTSTIAIPVAHDHAQLTHSRNGHDLTISWDTPDAESVLESTDSLAHPDWQPVAKGTKSQLNLPTDIGSKFYRLRQ